MCISSHHIASSTIHSECGWDIGSVFLAIVPYLFSVAIAMFVVLTRRLSFYQDPSSYFSVLYGSMLVAVKRLVGCD